MKFKRPCKHKRKQQQQQKQERKNLFPAQEQSVLVHLQTPGRGEEFVAEDSPMAPPDQKSFPTFFVHVIPVTEM